MPGYTAPSFSAFGRNEYLRSTRGHIFEHYTIAATSVASDANGNKVLQTGTVLARITSASGTSLASDVGKVGPFQPSATDGRQTVANIVGVNDSFYPYQLARGDREVAVLKHGRIVGANCYEYDSIAAPVQAATGTATTGGTLAAGTYRYVVTAVNGVGETVASNEQSQVTTGATSTVTVTWAAPSQTNGLVKYNVYRTALNGGAGTEVFLASVNAGTVTYVDTGAVALGTAVPPTTNGTMLAPGTRGLSSTTIAALVAGNGQNDLSLLVY